MFFFFEQIGTPQELYHAPGTAFVAGFVGDSNRWEARVTAADGTGVRAETADGTAFLCTSAATPPRAGDPVEVYVRPETITIAPAGGGAAATDDNRLEGTIDSLLFNGAASRVLVRIGGAMIEAGYPAAGAAVDLAPGTPVALVWPRVQTRAFPRKG